MTLAELQADTYDAMPTVQRTLAGRFVCNRIVRRAVAGWPVPVLEQCDDAQAAVVGKYEARRVERQIRQEMGMGIILTLVLSALVSEVVKYLIRRWLENREEMRALVGEVRHHD